MEVRLVGYEVIDHRASPPSVQRKYGRVVERETRACCHCQAVVYAKTWREEGGFCHACFGPLCVHCAARMAVHGCENFKRKIDQQWDRMQKGMP